MGPAGRPQMDSWARLRLESQEGARKAQRFDGEWEGQLTGGMALASSSAGARCRHLNVLWVNHHFHLVHLRRAEAHPRYTTGMLHERPNPGARTNTPCAAKDNCTLTGWDHEPSGYASG